MTGRNARIIGFLTAAGWGEAEMRSLAGDASNRRYLRLFRPGETAVLMDAPAERGEDVRPFLRMARHLSSIGLSAPRILAEDPALGLLLLEDLGDALYRRVLDADPGQESTLYRAAADLLAELHRHPPPPGLATYSAAEMTRRAAFAFDWYRKGVAGDDGGPAYGEFLTAMEDALDTLAPGQTVPALLDYHAENLLWLPQRRDVARVGLLDFQDAMLAHPVYDLVSLVTDARRDVSDACRADTVTHFLDRTGHGADATAAAIAAVSVQRNLRIVGVFARLCIRDGKPGYLRLLPRVWAYLIRDLAHPRLSRLRSIVESALPEPDRSALARLEALCPPPSP